MISRRQFIFGAAALAASPSLSFGSEGKHRLKNLGFISGILENELRGDWKAVLKQAVAYGFVEYEGGLLGDSPAAFVSYCNSIGLKPIAGGLDMSTDMGNVRDGLDKLNALKMEYAVVYWPWLEHWTVGSPFMLDDCKRSAELLNQMGALARENGLTLCWHNHDREFRAMEKGLPFHCLMAHTDPELVKCEMDIYWVVKGNADPVDLLSRYPGRVPILHVKDMAPGAERSFACPGSGIIDFPTIFAEADRRGVQHYIVERDKVVDGLACLKSAGDYLKNLRF